VKNITALTAIFARPAAKTVAVSAEAINQAEKGPNWAMGLPMPNTWSGRIKKRNEKSSGN
jgi:hypothetical protein